MKADEGVGREEEPPLGEEEFDSSVMDTPEQPPPDTTEADEALAAMLESGGRRKRGSALKAAEKIQTAMSTAPLKVGRDPRSCRLPSHCCLLTHGLRNLCPSSRPLRRSPPPWNVTALRLPPSRDPVPVASHPPRVCCCKEGLLVGMDRRVLRVPVSRCSLRRSTAHAFHSPLTRVTAAYRPRRAAHSQEAARNPRGRSQRVSPCPLPLGHPWANTSCSGSALAC